MIARNPLVEDDMIWIIKEAIRAHPRSLQDAIGPSEIGTPCARKLAYRLHKVPNARQPIIPWQATVGTAVHTWLAEAFQAANNLWPDSPPRWLTDLMVTVGEIDGTPISGHLDLFDDGTATIVDFKIPGPTSLKKKKAANHPGEEYRVQLHSYARGAVAAGLHVEHVGLLALPAAGQLDDHWYWTEPYDESVAVSALNRASGIAAGLRIIGAPLFAQLPTVDDYCYFCPWLNTETKDAASACPGHGERSDPGPAFTFTR